MPNASHASADNAIGQAQGITITSLTIDMEDILNKFLKFTQRMPHTWSTACFVS